MKRFMTYSTFLCILIFTISCNTSKKSYPVILQQSDTEQLTKILVSGTIGSFIPIYYEGKKEHKYLFVLNEEGKRQKYDEIGFQSGDVIYYEVIVTNPYEFDEFLKEFDIPSQGTTTSY